MRLDVDINESVRRLFSMGTTQLPNLLDEPTEALPNGIPADGFIRLSDAPGMGYALDEARLARLRIG